MARSLNKKYFGNRNIGTGGQQLTVDENGNVITPADDKIGGEGVADVTITAVGAYTSALPTATFATPGIPGGVRATGIVHGKIVSASTSTNGSGYSVNDILSISGGTYTTQGQVRVTKIVSVTVTKHLNSGTGFTNGQTITFGQAGVAGCVTPLITTVYRPGGGSGSSDDYHLVVQAGVWSSTPSNPVAMTSTNGGGSGATVDITWGVYSTDVVTEEGDYTVIATGARATTASPAGGTGATFAITYGVKNIAITEKGSGYTLIDDSAVTFSSGTAAGTIVVTTDSGDVGSSTNQENAIVPFAKTSDVGTSKQADIIRQVGARRFKVTTRDGTATCTLKGSAVSATGEMTITAYDSAGGTYFVTKISGRRATVTRGTGTQFATDSSVPWTFGSAVLNTSVKIANA